MKKYLKITLYTFLTLFILIIISGILVLSHPFFLNTYANLLIKSNAIAPEFAFEFQGCSKEEFAAKYLNTSLAPEDDFISLFESHYGVDNSDILIVIYYIQDPEDRSIHTLYGMFFLNPDVKSVYKCGVNFPATFEFQSYSKEEFAAEYLNTSLTPEDDFISLFESRYGAVNSDILIVVYDIQDPEDRSIHTVYEINECTDLVFRSTLKIQLIDEERSEILKENQSANISSLGSCSKGYEKWKKD